MAGKVQVILIVIGCTVGFSLMLLIPLGTSDAGLPTSQQPFEKARYLQPRQERSSDSFMLNPSNVTCEDGENVSILCNASVTGYVLWSMNNDSLDFSAQQRLGITTNLYHLFLRCGPQFNNSNFTCTDSNRRHIASYRVRVTVASRPGTTQGPRTTHGPRTTQGSRTTTTSKGNSAPLHF
jgi:hypothetical protein